MSHENVIIKLEKQRNIDLIKGYAFSIIAHLIIAAILNSIKITIIDWNKALILDKKAEVIIKIPKINYEKKIIKDAIKQPKLIKNIKKINKQPIQPKTEKVNFSVKNNDEIISEVHDKANNIPNEKQKEIVKIEQDKAEIPAAPPSKIILSESQTSLKSSFEIKFNQSEVVRGKNTYIGNAIGTAPIGLGSPLGNKYTINRNGSDKVADKPASFDTAANSKINKSNDNSKDDKRVYEIYELDKTPELENFIKPEYPELARRMGISGKVLLKLLISTEGEIKKMEIIGESGKVGFEEAAMLAVKEWQYSVPKVNNHPVSIWLVVPIVFTLD